MRRTTCACDNDMKTTLTGRLCVFNQTVWRAVSRDDPLLMSNTQIVEDHAGVAHNVPVGLASHDDTDTDRHVVLKGFVGGEDLAHSGNIIRDETGLNPRNLIFELELALFEALELKLVEGMMDKTLDDGIKIAMLAAQFVQTF